MLARGGLFGFIFRNNYRCYFIKNAVNRLIDRFIDIFFKNQVIKRDGDFKATSFFSLQFLYAETAIFDYNILKVLSAPEFVYP